ncbi:MAG TPA: hypothetical protein VF501_06955 [Thiobacillus sp.]
MKNIKLNAGMAALLSAGALLMTAPVISSAAAVGQGWDALSAGDGERIPVSDKAYVGTSLTSAPKQGFDILNLHRDLAAYRGMSQVAAPTGDSDVFRAGIQ